MQTEQIYYTDPYKKDLKTKVVLVTLNGSLNNIILDKTIFYPEGGGQPCDRGFINDIKVEYVRMINGEIVHQIKGNLEKG